MEYCIIYLSSSVGLLSDKEITSTFEQSKEEIRALGITGIALYMNGSILNVIEGPEEQAKALYKAICQRPDHRGVIELYNDSIEHRSFSDWSLGYKTLSAKHVDHLKGELPFMNELYSTASRKSNVILSIVEVFYQNNYLN